MASDLTDAEIIAAMDTWQQASPQQKAGIVRALANENAKLKAELATLHASLHHLRAGRACSDAWTEETPTVRGWYWLREKDGGLSIIELHAREPNGPLCYMIDMDYALRADSMGGLWCGPLQPPSPDRQLAPDPPALPLPIDSAPKDGTHVLCWRKSGGWTEAWWRLAATAAGQEPHAGGWGGEGWWYPDWNQPTHWLPLPAAPDPTPEAKP